MPRAPRFWEPRAFGGPALTLFHLFPNFLSPVSSRGPKSQNSPENARAQNLKREAPKSGAPNGFFVPCFNAGAKQPKSHRKRDVQKCKTRGPKGFLFPAVSVSARGPKEPMVPRKRQAQNLKIEAPNGFFVPCFSAGSKQRGPQWTKCEAQHKKMRGSKISKFAVSC
jgi:hypothetical protein